MGHEYIQPHLGSRLDEKMFVSLHFKLTFLPKGRDSSLIDEETNSARPFEGTGEFCLLQIYEDTQDLSIICNLRTDVKK